MPKQLSQNARVFGRILLLSMVHIIAIMQTKCARHPTERPMVDEFHLSDDSEELKAPFPASCEPKQRNADATGSAQLQLPVQTVAVTISAETQ